MILVGEAIEEVQELYSKGVIKDAKLTSRYVYSTLLNCRATIVKQQINKNQSVSQWSYQLLPCVELEKKKLQHSDKEVLISKYRLPTPILGLADYMIDSITNIEGTIKLDKTTFQTVKYNSGKKYTSNKPTTYIRNQHIFIENVAEWKAVSIYGLFYDPIEAARFPSLCDDCLDCKCKDNNFFNFMVDGDTLRAIIQLTVSELLIVHQSKEKPQPQEQ